LVGKLFFRKFALTTPNFVNPTLLALLAALQGQRFDLGNEKRLQAELAARFVDQGIAHEREYRFDPQSIIDFLVGDVGVEVKIHGGAKDIHRQCVRYCAHPQVATLLLLTNKIIGLPPLLNGKPAVVFNLGRAWL
jgi:hypothetical protein